MPIEFRNVSLGPLKDLTVTAPAGAIIGVIGGKNSGVAELLKLACGTASPTTMSALACAWAVPTPSNTNGTASAASRRLRIAARFMPSSGHGS